NVKKKDLLEIYPRPQLKVVPLASKQSLSSFVSQYGLLRVTEVKLIDPNDEADNNEFFRQVREQKLNIGSKATSIRHSNSTGLNKAAAVEQLEAAAAQGNSEIKLEGTDRSGVKLRGDNHHFKIST